MTERLRSFEVLAVLSLLDQPAQLEALGGPDVVAGIRKLIHGYLQQPRTQPAAVAPAAQELDALEPRTERWLRAPPDL